MFSSVLSLNCVWPFATCPSPTPGVYLTHVHWVSDAIQPFHPLPSPSLPIFNLSQHQGLYESVLIRWPKYWSFSFSISPSNEYSRLTFFRMDWFDLLAVQRTLKSLQHHSLKASILQHSAFFTVQLSHLYMITREPVAKWCLCFLICCLGWS